MTYPCMARLLPCFQERIRIPDDKMEYYKDLAEMYVGDDVSPDFYGKSLLLFSCACPPGSRKSWLAGHACSLYLYLLGSPARVCAQERQAGCLRLWRLSCLYLYLVTDHCSPFFNSCYPHQERAGRQATHAHRTCVLFLVACTSTSSGALRVMAEHYWR